MHRTSTGPEPAEPATRAACSLFMAALRIAAVGLLCASAAQAELPVEPLSVATLPARASAHWVWVNDYVFPHMADGKAYLVDADAGRFLGMVSTGFAHNGVVPARGGSIYSPESYFSRGTRGVRTDVVTIYSSTSLAPVGEIAIPPKRATHMSMLASAVLTDDERFLLVYNFTPAQSVTVVDARSRKFVGEVETAGCALVYPTGARSFFSICPNGALLDVTLDERGGTGSIKRTEPVFDVEKDPVTEKGVRVGSTWWFASFAGQMHAVEATPAGLKATRTWSLTTEPERVQGWRSGGLQHLAVHGSTRRLYAIMHQGGPDTHKDPGKEVWVYDLDAARRTQRIEMKHPVTSITVSQDANPLLFACSIERGALHVHDARSGRYLRSIDELGLTPTTLVSF